MLRLADRQPADRIAIEPDIDQAARRTLAQGRVHTALHNAEQCCVIAFVGLLGAHRPAQRQLHRALRYVFGGRIRRAFVEDHHDVRIQHALDAHALLGRQKDLGAIDRRRKLDAFLGDLAAMRQRKHLKPTRIGEDRLVPADKAVQPAEAFNHLKAGAQKQMKGIAENDLGADFVQRGRSHALDRAIGADWHETRGFDRAAGKTQASTARATVLAQQGKLHATHDVAGSSHIASP